MAPKIAPSVAVGSQVVLLDGPGQFAEVGLASVSGVVVGSEATAWGVFVQILGDDGETYEAQRIQDGSQGALGLGWFTPQA